MQSFLVGVDGGGTKTRAILANEHGKQIAEAVGAGSTVKPQEAERSAGVIAGVVRDVLEDADKTGTKPRILYVGVAGVGRPSEREALYEALSTHQLAEELVIDTDFSVALTDAFGEGPGVLLIAGTGSSAFARGPAGATARCGGWGPVIGDEGSGS